MSNREVEILMQARQLFAGNPRPATLQAGLEAYAETLERQSRIDTGSAHERYRQAVLAQRRLLICSANTDAVATAVLAAAVADHATARQQADGVIAAAHADAAATSDTPLAQREAMRRRVARLRAQHAHVVAARHRARAHHAGLRRLHYRGRRHDGGLNRLHLPDSRAGLAVRAALSRLGKPYVWGATGPNCFDCSGLTQWAYHQAGVPLSRTTYTQITEGIPVSRADIRPGDLVFPSTGHVQLAIGGGRVIEAPHAGACVQISALGAHVAIRRVMP